MECRVSKKGCYKTLSKGQLFYRVRVSDGSEVLVCHACLRGGAPFEALISSGVQGNEEEAKAPKAKPAKRTNVVDTKEQERKALLRSALEDAKEEEVSDDA